MTTETSQPSPWRALWALLVGFFMILVDSTIVTVAVPAVMHDLNADINEVIWVTSAFLLAYAVPLLITGRLGDRFGPKRLYLIGLAVFTIASLACGLANNIETLIGARVVQGFGAAMLSPQTMAIITRTFPPNRRGAAMGLWGSTAGVAILVGPIAGGLLVDSLGWEWIFFINVPVGVVGFLLALRLVPKLDTNPHRFDLLGVGLSALGMFCLVFGIQEGESYDWGTLTGPVTVWRLIIVGVLVLGVFLWWQKVNRREPLLPLDLFRDRNFSVASLAISTMGFAVTAMAFPLMLFAQVGRGLTPTESALLMLPNAVLTMVLAPVVGRYINTHNPKPVAIIGFLGFSAALAWYAYLMQPGISILWLLGPAAVMGFFGTGIWGPLSVSATRNLPPHHAGAGAGVYNTVRQVGAVIGSAAISAFMQARLAAELPTGGGSAGAAGSGAGPGSGSGGEAMMMSGSRIPSVLEAGFSTAMGQSMLMCAAVLLVGVAACLFLVWRPSMATQTRAAAPGDA